MNQNFLWWIGQCGIFVELIGAGLIVVFAYSAKKKVSTLKTDMDNIQESVDNLLEEVSSQFKKQVLGFILLGIGLIMQLVGNFSNK